MAQGCLLLRSTPWSSEIPISDAMVMVYDFFNPISDATVSRHQFGSDIAWPAHHFYWQMTFLFNRNKTNKTRRHCSLAWLAMQKPLGLLQTWYLSFLWHGYLFFKRKKEGKHNHKRKRTVTNIKFGLIARCNSIAVPNTSPASLGIGFDNRGV